VPETSPARSVLLAAWGTAWLRGRVGLDDVVAVVTGDDEPHRVAPIGGNGAGGNGAGGDDEPAPLAWALGRLRGAGAIGLRATLPVPGDVVGLPGPGPFSTAALAAGEGVVVLGAGLGIVPRVQRHGTVREGQAVTVRWERYDVPETGGSALAGLPQVNEAEHDLQAALREATTALLALDIARWRPEVADALRALRAGEGPQRGAAALPPGHPPRAVRLYAQAARLGTVVALAGSDEGGALVAGEVRARRDALAALGRSVHRARLAAANAALEEPRPAGYEHRAGLPRGR
jgi:hypothetical protein